MGRRTMRRAAALVAVTLAAPSAAGCAQTVDGRAERWRPAALDPGRSFGYADDRCGLQTDEGIRDMLDAESIERPYSGAVCQYVLAASGGLVDLVYSWFDTGSLARERTLAADRGSLITDREVARHPAFLAQRSNNAAACTATAAAGPGVASWWVQFRPQNGRDACTVAEQLLSATLSAET